MAAVSLPGAEIAAAKTAGRPPIQDRRYRDITGAVIADQGGLARMSEARQQLIRRFAAAAVIPEQMESRLANGQEIDITQHSLLASTLVRIAQRIGIDRKLRRVVPSLAEYLEHKDSEAVT
jgi:hypothetical protein